MRTIQNQRIAAVRLYFSYRHLPELARFTPRQKEIVWLNWLEERSGSTHSLRIPRLMSALLITGISAAVIFGAMTMSSPPVGAFIGGVVGIPVTLLGWHVCLLHNARRELRDYIVSDSFSLLPISRRVRTFLDPGRKHDT